MTRENAESDQIFRTAFGVPHKPVESQVSKKANKGKKVPVVNPLDNLDFMKKLDDEFEDFANDRKEKKRRKEAEKLKMMSLVRKNTYFDIAGEQEESASSESIDDEKDEKTILRL